MRALAVVGTRRQVVVEEAVGSNVDVVLVVVLGVMAAEVVGLSVVDSKSVRLVCRVPCSSNVVKLSQ